MSISSPRINVMLDSVRSASKQLMRDFNELQISNVKSADFINKTYSRSKQTIYNCLHDYKQDYGFIFEDDIDQEAKEKDYTWFIMPIEGRENFSSRMVYFAVSVCLVHKNKVVAAVVNTPALRETFWAEEKKGAFLEDFRSRHIKMRMKSHEGSLIDVSGNLLNKLLPGNSNIRSVGSTVLGFTYLAAGRYSGIVYSGVNKYKALLGRLLLQESAGRLTEDNGFIIAGDVKLT
ncbi:inositol monophosphatase family protein [Wolbachia endosymbiont of Brugia malayi]|uniref:inositol monophosphatase family protein n=1 Tax=Wolbachia endosymbiont of Brugia malayi TaxID=80849 RepID=UPI00004C9294|nr:inositol monophosphatase family protein [Wolbachia endosymbiont of Brugia malayi]AAW70723.1 Probable fructose-1,6-bisphosphatase, inositol monophosphatase family [Wolbachia endosymbiont strain TRS of Brugia malayi]QCB61700.1 inositol monophosphatase family protein [Wolbachia endosymbiont of Brugia malayi]